MHRTPMHQIHLYNHQQQQPLIISNPMLSVLAPLTNNSQAITDIEFYSNINQNCYNNNQDILSAYSGVDQINATEEQINSTLNNNMSNIVYTNDPMSELIFMKNTIRLFYNTNIINRRGETSYLGRILKANTFSGSA